MAAALQAAHLGSSTRTSGTEQSLWMRMDRGRQPEAGLCQALLGGVCGGEEPNVSPHTVWRPKAAQL